MQWVKVASPVGARNKTAFAIIADMHFVYSRATNCVSPKGFHVLKMTKYEHSVQYINNHTETQLIPVYVNRFSS